MSKIYELTDENIKNLIIFLDRIDYKGLKESQAINEIIMALSNPLSFPVDGTKEDSGEGQ